MFMLPLVGLAYWWMPFAWELDNGVVYEAPLFKGVSHLVANVVWLSTIIAFLLVVGSGILLNRILIYHEFYPKTTYLPALLYVLLSSLYVFQLGMHPLVWANLFTILALNQLLGIYRQQSAKARIFNAGLFLAIGVLFFWPMALVVPVLFMALTVIRPFVWREWFLAIAGLGLPLLFTVTVYYVAQLSFPTIQFNFDISKIERAFTGENDIVGGILWGTILLTTLVSLWHFGKVRSRASNRLRKLMVVFGLYALLLYGAYLASCMMDEVTPRFGIVLVPLAMLFTYPVIGSKRAWLPYLLFYVLLGSSVVNYWLHFSGS